jgi:flagellar biosynthetic protein FlhB
MAATQTFAQRTPTLSMRSDSTQDKPLPATAQRLKAAHDAGQVVRSRDLGHLVAIAASLGLVGVVAPAVIQQLRGLLEGALRFDAAAMARPAFMVERLVAVVPVLLTLGLALGGVVAVCSVAGSLVSGGWVFRVRTCAPNLARLDPLKGLLDLLSLERLGLALKSCVLALLLGGVGVLWMWRHREDGLHHQAMTLSTALATAGQQIVSGLWWLVLVLALAAAIDWPLQRWLHGSRLKMSHQDVQDERRQQDGLPLVKAARRRQRLKVVA